ncbi:MAG: ATP-dependent helicase [Haloechinothrix sp.]
MADSAPADVLDLFSPATRAWFTGAFSAPTAAQAGAWRAAHAGENPLVIAPTGSGKTLAAFLWAVDRLATEPHPSQPKHRCRVLYVSPLKALAVDVQRNLRAPLAGITEAGHALGSPTPDITVGIRTGDTTSAERRSFARTPPDILVTTPESLFLILTSAARDSLRGVRTVIIDEVHAVAGTKRGAHLALSLERLDALLPRRAQRIGLSATVRPVEEVRTFLAGGRPTRVVQPPTPKTIEVRVEVPVADMATVDAPAVAPRTQPLPSEGGIGTQEEIAGTAARRPSIWPAVEQRILDLVLAHRSTIVFANSRRIAERLTARLNELHSGPAVVERFPAELIGESGLTTGVPDQVVARAHHGSMAREQRTLVEEELKSGRLPCVVATSSLELGIDMGAVDLVVQVEAPPTVASGLQRIGRAGHHVGAVSSGIVFPKFRGDLVSCAVVAERMTNGAIEELRYPRNPLDVLAQQIVAMLALEPCTVDDLAAVIRGAAPFSALPDSALYAVLDMLAGKYPSTDFGELRPRITWNRTTGELSGRPGSQRLAVTSGGTIPDRGLFTVMTPSSAEGPGSRVGELDEEMVYESRAGDTILLGTSSWRITDITHDRVMVVPAPGEAARMPFWKGDTPGRPLELGRAQGAFLRELSTLDEPAARERAAAAGLDEWACDNLLAYLTDQQAATTVIPHDTTVVVERFRDELGDWRVVVHSPFGARVNAPWALAIGARLRDRRGIDVKLAHSDDGIVLRMPDALEADGTPVAITLDDLILEPDDVESTTVAEVGGSALFSARFRECAARSLLLPRRDPRRRQPLWQQRQRASQLLAVAAQYPRFPVVLEAMRECLQDVYDVEGLRSLMADVSARRVRVVEVETPSASPFARSLLFGYVGMFMYSSDVPLAERRAAALSLDSALLAELLGTDSIRELLDADVIVAVERQLQHLVEDRHALDPEDAADLLRVLGDLSLPEASERGVSEDWLHALESAGRAIRLRIAGEERFVAIEDAGRYRDALGLVLPAALPESFTEPADDPLGELLSRYARRHSPFTATQAATRLGVGSAVVTEVLDRLAANGTLVRGELIPIGHPQHAADSARTSTDYCDAGVLRRLRRACLARLRAEVEPVEPAALGRFLPAWHGVEAAGGARSRRLRAAPTVDDVLACVEQLAGAPLPASALESMVLPARLPGYSPGLLDELTTSGEVTWCGCGSLPGGDGWIALAPGDVADLLLPDLDEPIPDSPLHVAIRSTLDGGALFFRQLADRVAAQLDQVPGDSEVLSALWELVWAGVVTADTLAPLRALVSGRGAAHRPRRSPPRTRYARLRASRAAISSRTGPPSAAGRWSLTPAREADPTRRALARADAFLERHGVLTRGALETDRTTGGFAAIYRVLRGMEDSGQVVRGYVVEGLGAAQFAARGAVDLLRSMSGTDPSSGRGAVVLAATDPAQPYGAALPWPSTVDRPGPGGPTRHRPGRKAGALTVLVDGYATLYVERGGRSLLSFTDDRPTLQVAANALADLVHSGRLGTLALRRTDGEQALTSQLAAVLREAGFRATPQGLRLRA